MHRGTPSFVDGCTQNILTHSAEARFSATPRLQVRTDIVKGTSRPKFLKDCRLVVPCPETEYLQVRACMFVKWAHAKAREAGQTLP